MARKVLHYERNACIRRFKRSANRCAFFNICNVILNLEIVDENRTNFELFSTCALCRGMPPVQVFGGVHCRVWSWGSFLP